MFIFGDDYWGKVDWVPGLFYVKTRFLHIWWFPILPRDSWLFRDDNSAAGLPRGIRIPLRWKSVGMAWLQACLLVAIVSFLGSGCFFLTLDSTGMHIHPVALAAVAWSIAVASGFLYWRSCQWMSPRIARAIELGKLLGMVPEEVELHWRITR